MDIDTTQNMARTVVNYTDFTLTVFLVKNKNWSDYVVCKNIKNLSRMLSLQKATWEPESKTIVSKFFHEKSVAM